MQITINIIGGGIRNVSRNPKITEATATPTYLARCSQLHSPCSLSAAAVALAHVADRRGFVRWITTDAFHGSKGPNGRSGPTRFPGKKRGFTAESEDGLGVGHRVAKMSRTRRPFGKTRPFAVFQPAAPDSTNDTSLKTASVLLQAAGHPRPLAPGQTSDGIPRRRTAAISTVPAMKSDQPIEADRHR